jgi:hypothetical protein
LRKPPQSSDWFCIDRLDDKFHFWITILVDTIEFSATLMSYVYGSLGTSVHSMPLSVIWANIGGESTETLDTESIMLQNGQSAKISMPAPPPVPAGSPITSVGAMIGNSDGDLAVEICAGTTCGQHNGCLPNLPTM